MATIYGVTDAGFVKKPFDQCFAEAKDTLRSAFGNGANVDDPAGPLGQLAGIMADRESEIWDAFEALYSSRDPDQATGVALDAICAISGAQRLPAYRSAVYCTLTGTAGTVIPAGSVASVTGTGVRFVQLDDATISAGGAVDKVRYAAEEAGPLGAPAGTVTNIETPVAGWDTITNIADATLGSDVETDADLRIRRTQSLASAGVSTVDSIRSALMQRTGVTQAIVFENTTLNTDSNNLPGKAIECLVVGGDPQDILSTIFLTKPAGIQSFGSESGIVIDSLGNSHSVNFSRPVQTPVYLVVNLKAGAGWPSGGEALVADQLAAWGQANLSIGTSVVAYQLKIAIQVPGVVDIPSLYVGLAAGPTSESTLQIGSRQIAQIDSSRIVVNLV